MTDGTTAKLAAKPIGWLSVLQFSTGDYDTDVDVAGLWPTREAAEEDAATPEMRERLCPGQRWVPCAVTPVEGGEHD